jgi:hypothetical protein
VPLGLGLPFTHLSRLLRGTRLQLGLGSDGRKHSPLVSRRFELIAANNELFIIVSCGFFNKHYVRTFVAIKYMNV